MTPVTCMAGRKVALFGLGGSGIATALALKAGGADVLAWDDGEAGLVKAEAQGIATCDLRDADWSDFAALVLSPGVPLTHPEPHWTVGLARAAGTEIIGDIELFCRERALIAPGSPFVAITGTNGKSTTTALIAHILRSAGRDVQMGGNIGTAILSLARPAPDRVHVIELSSFQIDLTPSFSLRADPSPAGEGGLARQREPGGENPAAAAPPRSAAPTRPSPAGEGSGPTVGVLLNITPDHLDRHGTMENYAAIKERVVASADFAIVSVDDEFSRAISARRSGPIECISVERLGSDGIFADGGRLVHSCVGETETLADLSGIASLRGAHNAQNAMAAVATCLALDLPPERIRAGLATFPGLAHRMEQVASLGRTIFVNDSKATNADSAEKALGSFSHVHWVLGGVPKAGGIEPLRALFTKIDKAYLIGEATEAFAMTLDGVVPFQRCGTLDRAVAAAAADAARSDAAEPVVLLSPACASYDQYPNFEKRGDHFRDLVRALPGAEMRS